MTGWIHLASESLPPTGPQRAPTVLGSRPERRPTTEPYDLSLSEAELIELVTRGLNDKEIAQHLVVSEHVIRKRLRRLRSKLATTSPHPPDPTTPMTTNELALAHLEERLASA